MNLTIKISGKNKDDIVKKLYHAIEKNLLDAVDKAIDERVDYLLSKNKCACHPSVLFNIE